MNVYSLQDQAKTNTEIEMCVCQCCLVVPVGPDPVQLQWMPAVNTFQDPGHGVCGSGIKAMVAFRPWSQWM